MEIKVDDQTLAELAPDLEVIRRLGQGSTASVFLARESALKRAVAVKVLHPQFLGDRTALRRFEREAQAAASISHANVTTIHRVGRLQDGRPYIVMEYIDGRSLSDMLAARGPLPLDEVRTIVTALASALAAAHAKGIVHRDVSPGNVFIENRTGRVVLSDFGIAGLLDSASNTSTRLTGVGQWLGDVRYCSPENLRGEAVTEQSDVYALGLVAFELVAGRGPFDPATVVELVSAHLQRPAPDVTTLRPETDRDLARVVQSCLAKEPNLRPRATDIGGLLRPSGTADGIGVADVGGFLRELKRRRVYQAIVTYVAAALVILQAVNMLQDAYPQLAFVFNTLVAVSVAGFPVALVVSWIYDIRQGRLLRTRTGKHGTYRHRLLPWIGLVLSVAISAALWLLLTR
ncbi:MAG: serine/threonine-protein kinase [Longimicrobiales bacterium]